MTTRIPLPPGSIASKDMTNQQKLELSLAEVEALSVRTVNILEVGGILTVEALLECDREDLSELRSFGDQSLLEVLAALKTLGFVPKNDT